MALKLEDGVLDHDPDNIHFDGLIGVENGGRRRSGPEGCRHRHWESLGSHDRIV